jgi:anti-sigma regulatory factor (Ser/Thr protein kinase)
LSVNYGDEIGSAPIRASRVTRPLESRWRAPAPVTSRRFGHELGAVREARLFASECSAGLTHDQESVLVLLVSELATNCLKHSHSDFEVSIDVDDRSARVQVTDEGPGVPRLRRPRKDAISGRGLLVVQALSDDWGVVRGDHGKGKTVWFSMSLA